MAIYRHSVWLSVVQSVSRRRHTNFGTFRMFQDGRASVSGQTFSRSGRFRIDFQSFQSNSPLSYHLIVSVVSVVPRFSPFQVSAVQDKTFSRAG